VSLGYWNAIEKTAERFKKTPGLAKEITNPALSVWSGDTVYRDEEGFLFFVGRKDDMIKTSGYRVSPTEVEETIYASGKVTEAAALGIPHPDLGQAVVIFATRSKGYIGDGADVLQLCQKTLPNFMVPKKICFLEALPHNANGKIDRKALLQQNSDMF
jgi:acyl-coenzyme A synthetase/AMP-(fatty) acid ligase